MGDNRDNSADSRVPVADGGVGMLPTEDLVGRVDAIVDPGPWHPQPSDLDLAVGLPPVAIFHIGALTALKLSIADRKASAISRHRR